MNWNRLRTIALAVCLVVAAAAAPVGGLVAPVGQGDAAGAVAPADGERSTTTTATTNGTDATGTTDANDTAESDNGTATDGTATDGTATSELTAGEAFASAVAAQDTDLEASVQRRAFDRRLATAGDGTARARLLDETVRDARLRLAVLEARRANLRAAHRNGTISPGRYRVAMARLTTEARSLRRVLAQADAEAERLPRETRAAYELSNATLADLRTRADLVGNRSGTGLDEVFAEPETTNRTAFDRPDWNDTLVDGFEVNDTGEYTLNGSDRYDDYHNATTNGTEDRYPERRQTLLTLEGNATELDGVHDHLAERSDGDREAEEALTCARDAIADARAHIEDARAALDAGEPGRADEHIADARAALTTARDCLEEARAALQDDDGSGDSTPTSTEWRTASK